MANKMLIDASHPEETRVVVLRGNRVEDFDFEAASKKQLRGNIYLAKVMRVEPSLQAAFVDYGGNRHGFLAFSEIHPDYYQIPIADRQALIEEEARAQRDEEDDVSRPLRRSRRFRRGDRNGQRAEKRRGADPTLSETPAEAYAGEASWDSAGRLRPEAESDEAGLEPFEGERPAGTPEESAGAGAQDAMSQT
ncbi:MAG: ribonuclease E/G, partial [Methylocella sp.]